MAAAGDATDGGWIHEVVAAVSDEEPTVISRREGHSNDVFEVRYPDDRVLIAKRGRWDWDFERFRASRRAGDRLRQAGVVAPRMLATPGEIGGRPVEAYWKIPYPTLHRIWPKLSNRDRRDALHSWGELLRRIHGVRCGGYGPLGADERHARLGDFLRHDLGERLLPAVQGEWEAVAAHVERLLAHVDAVDARARGGPRLLHNDVHMQNVLCRLDAAARPRCVGIIDLEAAMAGPPEADLASAEVHHGPLYERDPMPGWSGRLRDGWAARPEPLVLAFFRAWNMLNFGIHAAIMDWQEHADNAAEQLDIETRRVERLAERRPRVRSGSTSQLPLGAR